MAIMYIAKLIGKQTSHDFIEYWRLRLSLPPAKYVE